MVSLSCVILLWNPKWKHSRFWLVLVCFLFVFFLKPSVGRPLFYAKNYFIAWWLISLLESSAIKSHGKLAPGRNLTDSYWRKSGQCSQASLARERTKWVWKWLWCWSLLTTDATFQVLPKLLSKMEKCWKIHYLPLLDISECDPQVMELKDVMGFSLTLQSAFNATAVSRKEIIKGRSLYLCFDHLFSQGMLFRCCQYSLFHINTAESSEINWCLQLPLPLLSSLAWVDSFRTEKTCHINLSIRPVQLWDLFSLSILLKKWVIWPQRFCNWGTGKKPFKNEDKIHKGAQLAIFGIIIHKFYLWGTKISTPS